METTIRLEERLTIDSPAIDNFYDTEGKWLNSYRSLIQNSLLCAATPKLAKSGTYKKIFELINSGKETIDLNNRQVSFIVDCSFEMKDSLCLALIKALYKSKKGASNE